MTFGFGLLVGLFIGACIGIFTISILIVGKRADEDLTIDLVARNEAGEESSIFSE